MCSVCTFCHCIINKSLFLSWNIQHWLNKYNLTQKYLVLKITHLFMVLCSSVLCSNITAASYDSRLLGRKLSLGQQVPMFQRTAVPSSSGFSSAKGTKTFQNITNYSPNDTVSQLSRLESLETPLWVPKILTWQQCSLWCRHPIVPSTNHFIVHVYTALHLNIFHYNLESMCCTTPLRSLFYMQNSFHWYKYWHNASSKLQPTDTEQGVRIACIHICTIAPVFTEE